MDSNPAPFIRVDWCPLVVNPETMHSGSVGAVLFCPRGYNLIMSTGRKYLPRYTIEDYLQWEGDWELIDGIAVSMAASPVRAHQRVAMRISAALFDALKVEGCRDCEVLYGLDWHVDEHTSVRPDIVVVCDAGTLEYLKSPPALVVEILSPSTAEKDRTFKFDIYQAQRVKYYMIADPDSDSTDVFELVGDRYVQQPKSSRYKFELVDRCQIEIEV